MGITQIAHPMTGTELDQLSVDTIRTLSIDAVQQAKSGHPGTPMALAPLVYTIWNRVMRFDPEDPIWPNRDRFVLSNGHASMLLWSVLHLTGTRAVNADYERLGQPSVSLEDIRRFRQIGSKAPGHPEYHWVSGVETTTGPLGQGVATSVGMAIARKWLADRYNRPGFPIFDYNIYAVCGDGGLMEGVASEAASLAGHLGLDNLCWVYDNNHITIEGQTSLAFTEDVAGRFLAYGWNVLRVGDANDLDRIEHALSVFRATKGRPTFIILDSHIGYGSPHRQDTAAAHGEPLGDEEVRLTKRSYGWPEDAQFLVPNGVREHFAAGIGARGAAARSGWTALLASYRAAYRELASEIAQMQLPSIFVFTHDAMGDGEDGPTHQPIEQLASLRAIPGLVTLRPGDANEVVEAYRYVMQLRHQPAVLVLSRQPLPTLDRRAYAPAAGVSRGAYVLADPPGGNPEVILIASGSELSLAVEAHEKLLAEGIRSRVVSMPAWDLFDHQPQEYRDSVLPPTVKARVAVEQASTFGWERYVGRSGHVIGMKTFGASAPLKELQRKYGFEPDQVVAAAKQQLGVS